MFFQDLLAPVDRLQASHRLGAATIVAAEIRPGLFALEHDGVPHGSVTLRTVGGDIGPIPALRKRNFQGRHRVTIFLRPKQSTPF
jgi:hypothetical protein